jgi:hypothetical protein
MIEPWAIADQDQRRAAVRDLAELAWETFEAYRRVGFGRRKAWRLTLMQLNAGFEQATVEMEEQEEGDA